MWMTKSEIARSYRESKNRNAQIGILAEMNLCSIEEIREVLVETGEIKAKGKKATPVVREKEKTVMGKKVPESILNFAYDKLDTIEKEIKDLEKLLKEKESEYKEIADFLDGK